MTLQAGRGDIPGDCYLPSEPDTVSWGWIPGPGASPRVQLTSGSTVTIDTISHEGILEDQGRDPVGFFGAFGLAPHEVLDDAVALAASTVAHDAGRDGPHVVCGPIAVDDACPGDLLEVEMVELTPRVPYGVISNRHGRGALPGELPVADEGDGAPSPVVSLFARILPGAGGSVGELRPYRPGGPALRFPVRPFLGLVATAGADGPLHSTAPGDHGGNLDVRDLVVGTSLLMPVRALGGLVSVADPHYAQGNGEVALTAFEAPLRATLRLTVHTDPAARRLSAAVGRPVGETPEHWVLFGLGSDLDDALRDAVRQSLRFLADRHGVDPQTALAYLSTAADFDVSQVVNGVKGVHCRITKADLAHLPPADPLRG